MTIAKIQVHIIPYHITKLVKTILLGILEYLNLEGLNLLGANG